MLQLTITPTAVLSTSKKNAVTPVYVFDKDAKRDAPKVQALDKENNLPVWKVNVQIEDGDNVDDLVLKIPAKDAPVFAKNTDYRVAEGVLIVTAYVNSSTNQQAYSGTLRGTLVPVNGRPIKQGE
ncbi:hypothetical protein B7R54_01725 [Subtercola boreus]|uniref:Plasmid replication, integration and excision activator n=1 Tax=Subtercola boreus TaxID=120213 RepID=A0A3E0VDS6_9MICO|nr:hypothetical protein [Subtercola boreus]RFA08074.1 hypothetical protein B7R54_01725 [Subtercola boreus]TQL55044.1 hypothetical protein FB464_2599 [Subtercola boreus]